jgi:hypothetical protein
LHLVSELLLTQSLKNVGDTSGTHPFGWHEPTGVAAARANRISTSTTLVNPATGVIVQVTFHGARPTSTREPQKSV